MMDYYQLASSSSYQESLLALEADIRHANALLGLGGRRVDWKGGSWK